MNTGFNLLDYYESVRQHDILLVYKGSITDVIIAEISRDIRVRFSNSPKVGRKLFAVFIELAQNILYYSAEKVQFGDLIDRVGSILLMEDKENYFLSCGNWVDNENIPFLKESCDKINSLDKENLRFYKRDQRILPSSSNSKGAGIGLIQVALTAEAPLQADFVSINEQYSFFSLTVKIKK